MEIVVFAVFMLLWKGLDTAYAAYQLYLSAKVEMHKENGPEEPHEEQRSIGFVDYGNKLREIEENEEE